MNHPINHYSEQLYLSNLSVRLKIPLAVSQTDHVQEQGHPSLTGNSVTQQPDNDTTRSYHQHDQIASPKAWTRDSFFGANFQRDDRFHPFHGSAPRGPSHWPTGHGWSRLVGSSRYNPFSGVLKRPADDDFYSPLLKRPATAVRYTVHRQRLATLSGNDPLSGVQANTREAGHYSATSDVAIHGLYYSNRPIAQPASRRSRASRANDSSVYEDPFVSTTKSVPLSTAPVSQGGDANSELQPC